MARDVLEIADRLWRGETEITEAHPVGGNLGALVEIGSGVAFVPSFANVSAFATGDGLVFVDTGSSFMARSIFDSVRGWSAAPLHTAVYSHGHIDHVFGVGVFEEEAAARGWPRPVVVAHEALPERFDRYVATAGYNTMVNRRQFQVPGLQWPTEYRYPDRTYRDRLDVEVGGTTFELHHAKGETDDHTWTWVPERKVLCCGDLFIWASPNAGNPQKVQRYPAEWAAALRLMLELDAEVLLPGHGFPVVGAERVRQALDDTATLLESLVEQTLALMNQGARLDEVLHAVQAPAELLGRPYLRPVYDEPEFVVRNIWRLYGGWYDGNPASLKPAPEAALARELCELAGGAGALCERALALLAGGPPAEAPGAEPGGTGEAHPFEADTARRLAGHLAELASLAEPDDPGVQRVRAAVFEALGAAATSTMAKGVFGWAAAESRAAAAVE